MIRVSRQVVRPWLLLMCPFFWNISPILAGKKNHTSISLRLALRRTFAVIARSWFGGSNTGRMNISIGAKCCENGFRLSKKWPRAVWMGAAGDVLMPARSYIELKTDVSWGHRAEQMPAMRSSAKLMVRALKHPKQPTTLGMLTTLGMDKNSGYCKQQLTAKIVPWQLVTNVGIQQKCLWTNKTLVNSRGTMYHMFPSIGSIDTPDVQAKRLQKKNSNYAKNMTKKMRTKPWIHEERFCPRKNIPVPPVKTNTANKQTPKFDQQQIRTLPAGNENHED